MGPKYMNKLVYDGYVKQYSSLHLYKACLEQRLDQFPISFELEVLDIYFKKGSISPSCKWRHAEVVGRSESEGTITVHYMEWSSNYDETLHVIFDSNRMRSINVNLPLTSVTTSMQFVLESFTKKMAAYEEQLQDELDSLSPSLDSLRTTEYSAASLDLSTYYQSMIRQSNAATKPSTGQQSQSPPRDSVSTGNNQNRLIKNDEDSNQPQNAPIVDDQEVELDDSDDNSYLLFNPLSSKVSDDDNFDGNYDDDDDNFDDNDNSYLDDDNNDDFEFDDKELNSKLRNTIEPSSVARHSRGNLLWANNDDYDYDDDDYGDDNHRFQVTRNGDDEGSDDSNEAIITSNDEVMANSNDEVMDSSNDAGNNDDVMVNSNDEGSNDELIIMRNDEVMVNSNDEGCNDELIIMRNDEVMAISNYEVMASSSDTGSNDDVIIMSNDEWGNDDVVIMSNNEWGNDDVVIMSNDEWGNDEVIETSSYEVIEQAINNDEVVSVNNQSKKKKNKAIIGKLFSRFRSTVKDPIINNELPARDNDDDGSVQRPTERLLLASDNNSAHHKSSSSSSSSKAKNGFFQKLKSVFAPLKRQMSSKGVEVDIPVELSEEQNRAIERELKERQSRKEAAEKMRRDQQFVSALESKGLHVFKIEGDGNCLFRAVSHQLYFNQTRHHELRLKAVDHLIAHRNRFEQFCFDEDFDTHVEEMRKLTTWGDDLEVRALEEITDRLIRIYRSDQDNFDEPSHDDPTEVDLLEGVSPIILSYHGGSHYNSVCDERYPLPLSRRRSRILLESRIASSGVKSSHTSGPNALIPRRHYDHPDRSYYDPRYGSQLSSNHILYNQPSSTVSSRSSHHYNQNIEVMPNSSSGAARYGGDWSRSHHYPRQVVPYYPSEQAWVDHPYTRSSSSEDASMSKLYFGDVSSIMSNPHASLRGEERYDPYPYRSNTAPSRAYQHGATQYINHGSSNSFYTDTEEASVGGGTYGIQHSRSNIQQYGYYR